jgi:hypothetical protein
MSTPDEQPAKQPDELEPETVKDLDVDAQDEENIHGGQSYGPSAPAPTK